MAASARFSGVVTIVSLAASGCQELVGIDPWGNASGGASSTSGTINAASADASSTGSGPTCAMDCMGGECVDGACLPHRVAIDDVHDGHVAILGSNIVVARKPTTGANATLSLVTKAAPHDATMFDATDTTIQAIATSPSAGYVFWAGAKSIHRIDSNGGDNVLTSSAGQAAIEIEAMTPARPGGGEPLICFLNVNSGVYCQPIAGQNEPMQFIQAVGPRGLAVDATHVFSTTNGGMPGASIVSSDGAASMFIRIADNAFALLRHGDGLYWLTTDDKVHHVSIQHPETLDVVEATSGSSARRLLAAGDFVYVLTSIGVERFRLTTLERDTSFVLPTGPVPLDFAVDDQGVYWLSGGFQTSELGFYALPPVTPGP